jgi:hypothetical protein
VPRSVLEDSRIVFRTEFEAEIFSTLAVSPPDHAPRNDQHYEENDDTRADDDLGAICIDIHIQFSIRFSLQSGKSRPPPRYAPMQSISNCRSFACQMGCAACLQVLLLLQSEMSLVLRWKTVAWKNF